MSVVCQYSETSLRIWSVQNSQKLDISGEYAIWMLEEVRAASQYSEEVAVRQTHEFMWIREPKK